MNAVALRGLQIVVLAAGFSQRLGQPKALVRIHGSSLLRRTVRVLEYFAVQRIWVVAPARAARYQVEIRGYPAALVTNLQRARGLSSSVSCGIVRARYSAAVLLLPVDLARLERRDIERLIARWCGNRRRIVARELPSRGGTPLILPRWMYPAALCASGDSGLRGLVSALPQTQVATVQMASAAADVDTPQDLLDARRRWRR